MKKMVKNQKQTRVVNRLSDNLKKDPERSKEDVKMYKFGFWLFFFLTIFSVTFSVWAISSIYSNFQVVTKILDESFERTNLVMDITSSKMMQCEEQVKECRAISGTFHAASP